MSVLNSSVTWWVLRRTCTDLQNGYLQALLANQLKIPIPPAVESDRSALQGLVTKILKVNQADAAADVSALEREIDHRMYRLFGLTCEEIEIIEESA